MKPIQTFGLSALVFALAATAGQSQNTPTGAATSTTYPQGAVVPDSTPASGNSRAQKRAARRNRTNQNSRDNSSQPNTNTSPQDAQYRQSSSSSGTSINNSNTTNYNTNNAVNAPTGAGSNPNTTNPSSTSGTPPGTDGSDNSARRQPAGSSSSAGVAAVANARTSKTPAVKAGSTERNTSIGDFVASSPNYTTLQNALQSAEMDVALKGNGPYTVFAPSNEAFKRLPTAVQAGLLEGRNREALKQLLAYHVVQENIDAQELNRRIKAGNGKAMLQTMAGATLTAQATNGGVTLTDEQGHSVRVSQTDQFQVNGVVHSIDSVLMNKMSASAFQ